LCYREQQSERAAKQRQQHASSIVVARSANDWLRGPRKAISCESCACQQKVGDIRTGNQQNESHRAQQIKSGLRISPVN
jgi:hypothetical protein